MSKFAGLLALALLTGAARGQSADELFRRAEGFFAEFTWDKAIEGFEQFVQRYPADPRVAEAEYKSLFASFRLNRLQDFEARAEAFAEKYRRTTWGARGRALWARFLYERQRWQSWEKIGNLYAEALRDWRTAIGRRPLDAAEKKVWAELTLEAARFYAEWWDDRARDLAKEHYESLIAAEVDAETTARAWFELGALYQRRLRDPAKMEAAWLTVVRQYPATEVAPAALLALAGADNSRGEYVLARARFLELVRRYPRTEEADQAAAQVKEITAPRVSLRVSQTHLPGAKIPTRLVTRNIKGVQLTAYRLDLDKLTADPQLLGRERDELVTRYGTKETTWRQELTDAGDYKWLETRLETPLTRPGLYVVVAEAVGPTALDRSLVNLSSLVLVQHYAARKLVSYVASRTTRQPTPGVEVTVFRQVQRGLRRLGAGTTNADGLDERTLPERGQGDGWQLVSIARRGDEVALQQQGLYTWWNEPARQLDGYIYTDRPVYRPGNTVHFKGILRHEEAGDFTNLPGRRVEVVIADARGEEILKQTLTTDDYGTLGGELTLGDEPALGLYAIRLTFDKQTVHGQFRVEEYRKPEFKVEIGRALAEVRPGGGAAIPVDAKYYFGAPVAEAEVHYTVQRRPYYHYYWWPGPWDWFYAGWREPRWHGGFRQEVVAEGVTRTDAEGRAIVEFPTLADGQDYTYSIHAEVVDVTRRVVDATGSLTVTQKGFYLFASPGQSLYAPGDDVTVNVNAEDAAKQPIETAVTTTLWALKWVEATTDPKTGRVTAPGRWERDRQVWAEAQVVRTDPATGRREQRFKAPADGYYEIALSARDTFDRETLITAETRFWVASDAWKGRNWDRANLQLITERDLYERGQTARVMVNSPVPTGAILLTIGADSIYETKVIRFDSPVTILDLPIVDRYAPNVYLDAVVVGAGRVYFADKEIQVPPTEELLKVTVASDRAEYKPRTKGIFTITTTDQAGRPVPAQVSLGLTDDSVYAIQEELASPIGVHFWGRRRGHEIRRAVSFEASGEYDEEMAKATEDRAERLMVDGPPAPMAAAPPGALRRGAVPEAAALDAAGMGGLGGGEGGEEPIAIREFFPDTILWQPAVVTGADGQATVTVDFPDSLTTWRATARALTRETKVGQQVERVITSKDLIVRLQAPRFFTQLDRATISVIVTNKTSAQQQVAVGLQVEGVELLGSPTDSVVLPPNGQARVDREVQVTRPGQAVLTATARGPEDSDGVKQTITIVPHGADKFATAAGPLGPTGVAEFTLNLPEARRQEATRLTVTMSPSLVTALLDALPYLVQYPYGCVEQTTSKFLPCVLVARILDYTGAPAPGDKPKQVPDWWQERGLEALPDMIDTGLKRLAGMRNPDGGFGWFGGMRSDIWMTSYVVYGLLQAQLADYTVPDDLLRGAVGFLLDNLPRLRQAHDSSAYVAWVLSECLTAKVLEPTAEQARQLEDAYQRVWANRDELNDYTRALLVLGLHNKGDREKAEIAWRNLVARRIETERGVHWGENRWGWRWSEDQVETTSFALMAALAMEPEGTLAGKAVNWLVLNRTGNRWHSTKDTAAAIFALTRYAEAHNELGQTYSVALKVNGQEVKGWEVTPQTALLAGGEVTVDPALLRSGENTISLTRSGPGGGYYSALLEYYTREDPITAASSYLAATRRYYRVREVTDPETKVRRTERTPLSEGELVASGEQVEVEIVVEAENDFDYICLRDPKPAGYEPVDQLSGGTWGGTWAYRELRDEAVTFFVDHLNQGRTTLSYRLRAESPGIFRALPHHGFSMYRPDVRCLSDEAILRIGERAPTREG